MKKVTGSCHCKAVSYEAEVDTKQTVLSCNCSVCSKSGFGKHVMALHADFTLLSGQGCLTSYRFGTKQAHHLFCSKCGVKSFYQPRSHPESWSLNSNCLDDFDENEWCIEVFDGQNWEKAKDQLEKNLET